MLVHSSQRKSGKGVARNGVDTHGGLVADVTDTDYWGQNGGVTHCRVLSPLRNVDFCILLKKKKKGRETE